MSSGRSPDGLASLEERFALRDMLDKAESAGMSNAGLAAMYKFAKHPSSAEAAINAIHACVDAQLPILLPLRQWVVRATSALAKQHGIKNRLRVDGTEKKKRHAVTLIVHFMADNYPQDEAIAAVAEITGYKKETLSKYYKDHPDWRKGSWDQIAKSPIYRFTPKPGDLGAGVTFTLKHARTGPQRGRPRKGGTK